MNILQRFILLITVLAGSFMVAGVGNIASAELFDNSKAEACKGANLNGADSTCNSDAAATKIENTIKFIVNLLTAVVGIVAVVLVIVNGLKFITSGGDSAKVTSAKSGISYAIVGLIVAALAQVIVRFVLGKV